MTAPAAQSSPTRAIARLRGPLLLGGLALGATALVAVVDPHDPGSYGFCPFRALTGWLCPGCGGLRAVHLITRGDLAGAWAMNPLVVVAVPAAIGLWAWWLLTRWRNRPGWAVPTAAVIGLAVLVLTFWLARNVPALMPFLGPAAGGS